MKNSPEKEKESEGEGTLQIIKFGNIGTVTES